MKSLATIALVLLACVPARAQFGGAGGGAGRPQQFPMQSIEIEILELEQEADRTALKEALVLQARQGMAPSPTTQSEKEQLAALTASLRDFIADKKKAMTARAAEMADRRTASRRTLAGPRPNPPQEGDRQAVIEKYEKAKIEAQLLEAEISLLQTPLEKAVQALAKAEIAASNDESQRPSLEAARKDYERIKAKVVEYNKRLQIEQETIQPMQIQMQRQRMGMGMGGGFQ